MTRLWPTLRWDIVLQFRNGFYAVSGFVILVVVGLWSQLPDATSLDYSLIIPGLMMVNLLITTFYFVGALVLLEKAEGTLTGLAVTPLRASEYLASKVLSLTLLAVLENLAIVLVIYGFTFEPLLLLGGMMLLGGFYTMLGFVAITRYDSINAYIFPSAVMVTLLMLPLLDHLGLWQNPIFYLHPLQPSLVLMRAAFDPLSTWQIAYGAIGSVLWFGLTFAWARRIFHGFVVRSAGDQG